MNKILYIANSLSNKNPTTTLTLQNILKKIGFEVLIFSDKKNKLIRLLEMCLAVFKHNNVSFILIDTYSTSNFYYALFTSQIARILSIKYIPILHGGNLPNRLAHNPFFSNLIFDNSYLNVTPSNYLKIKFEKKGFKTVKISNALQLNNYIYKERSLIKPKLLWVRAFDKIYNPLMAINVLSRLKEKYPLASLCMIGPDKDGFMLKVKKKVEKLKISDSVEFTGFLSKKEWIQKSKDFDIFINTTTVDNIPVSLIEAMALGMPVVSTNVGGISYFIDSYKNGVLVENNNASQMVEEINTLIKNPKLVTKITKNAKNNLTSYSEDEVLNKWKKLLI